MNENLLIRTKHSVLPLAIALTVSFGVLAPQHANAVECANDGAGANSGNDNGVASNTACGRNADATGGNASAFGDNANATGPRSVAVGNDSDADSAASIAVGDNADATAIEAIAIGENAQASGRTSIAIGGDEDGGGDGAQALTRQSIAIGGDATVQPGTGINGNAGGIAIGGDVDGDTVGAQAVGPRSLAIGSDAIANPEVFGDPGDARATAIGSQAEALNGRATAVGSQAIAGGPRSTAIGTESVARGRASVAIGNNAQTGSPGVGARNAVAIGNNTNAQADGSVAIGADSSDNGAVATLENQFVLGTANHTYTAPGITSDLSRARQSGPLELVSTDAAGNLASDGGEIFRKLGEHGAGIAIAVALENPDLVADETFGLAANIGFFEGNTAFAASAMGVLGHDFMGGGERWAVSGGVGLSLNENNYGGHSTDHTVAGRAGVQVSW